MKVAVLYFYFTLFTLFSCEASREVYRYSICVQQKTEPSRFVSIETIGIADTVVAIVLLDTKDYSTNDYIPHVPITFTDLVKNDTLKFETSDTGHLLAYLNPGQYIVTCKCTVFGYSELTYSNLILKSGEIKHIAAGLGGGTVVTDKILISNTPLNNDQIEAKKRELNSQIIKWSK